MAERLPYSVSRGIETPARVRSRELNKRFCPQVRLRLRDGILTL